MYCQCFWLFFRVSTSKIRQTHNMASPFGLRKRKYSRQKFFKLLVIFKKAFIRQVLNNWLLSARSRWPLGGLFYCMKRVVCQCYKTTLRLDFLHSFMVCRHCSDTQNPEISGFSTAHAYKTQNQTSSKNEAKTDKNDTFVG